MNEKEIAKFQQATWTRAADGARDNVMRLTASVQGGKNIGEVAFNIGANFTYNKN